MREMHRKENKKKKKEAALVAAPEPRGAARLPTEAAGVLPGVPVLVVATSRPKRARAGTKTVHWGQRVQGKVWGRVWLVLVGAWAEALA